MLVVMGLSGFVFGMCALGGYLEGNKHGWVDPYDAPAVALCGFLAAANFACLAAAL